MASNNDLSISQTFPQSTMGVGDFQNQAGYGASRNVVQAIREYTAKNTAVNTMRFPLDTPKYYVRLNIMEYSRQTLMTVARNTPTDRIILPLPSPLAITAGVRYQEQELGIGVGNIANGLSNLAQGNVVDGLVEGAVGGVTAGAGLLSAGLQGFVDNIPNPATRSSAQGLLRAGHGAIGMAAAGATAAEALAGYVPNKYFTVLLVGPEYTTYTFTWVLVPNNRQESEAIRRIIYTLNEAKAPRLTGKGLFWGWPKLIEMQYFPNDGYLNKFKPAVVDNIQINFAPGGTPAFYAGDNGANPPEAVSITLHCKEIEYWKAGDYSMFNTTDDGNTGGGPQVPNGD